MNSKISKILTLGVALVSVIGILLFVNVSTKGEDTQALAGAVGPLIEYSVWLLYITIGVTIVLSLLNLIKNPENLKKTLLGLAVMGVLLIISYFLGDNAAVLDAQGAVLKGGEQGTSLNKWVGSLIWYATILVVIGGAFFIIDLIKGLVKS